MYYIVPQTFPSIPYAIFTLTSIVRTLVCCYYYILILLRGEGMVCPEDMQASFFW